MPGFGVLVIPGSTDELWRCAKICPVARVMRPYLEALRDYRRQHRAGMDELWYFANICRVAKVMRPYLEALG